MKLLGKTGTLLAIFLGAVLPVFGQSYLSDLQNGDLDTVEKKLGILDSSFKTEPVLAYYLGTSAAKPEIVIELLARGASATMVSPKTKLPPWLSQ